MGFLDNFLAGFGMSASAQVNPAVNSSIQLGGQANKAYTYQPTKNVQSSKTLTYSPTSTNTTTIAPVYSSQSTYSPQSTYAPALFISSPFASTNVSPSIAGMISAGLSPSPSTSSLTNPNTSVSPSIEGGAFPQTTASPAQFDFSALLPFILVGALAVFLLKTGGGKK